MEHQILAWISQYGYVAIFSLLVLGIVGLPVPDETLLTFTGYLVFKGHLSLVPAFASGFLGSVCGITLSYWLGRSFGMMLIHRFGKYLRIRPDHLEKSQAWFTRVGYWSLTFGYYIPGVRHFTAYVAGMSGLPLPRFAIFAYSGAAIWVSTFITLGYFLGERWEAVQRDIHHYFLYVTIGVAILAVAYLLWRKYRQRAQ